jgi:hypothetical protein
MVWLDCDGEDDPDKENIGSVSYTPWYVLWHGLRGAKLGYFWLG